ncbi:ABC transporter ATP-binding protein [Gordonia humi]|uniref:ABC-type nitrate/sulfonate/bicarbonate transport system ATPase subunit n=1 Tax=Gordonia humi TaxID=686429 RepID=A0A840EZY9_9ACTN|nr:ABC-type nitrate/sulfonate/bicarbonate transport system ATPase subunit [Gordonia humi]
MALSGVDLTIGDREFVAVLGKSGSGKSTLLRVLAGLDTLDSGIVEWSGSESATRSHTGVVFQQPLLMPWLTVLENVEFGQRFASQRDRIDGNRARDLLSRFGLDALAQRRPAQLSGGQAQRVAIIRAAAVAPRLLLLDEPFSALDPAVRGDLRGWLAELADELGMTVVLVTHDVEEALELADRIVLLGDNGTIRGQWCLESADRVDPVLRSAIFDSYRDPVGERS